jgi:CDP-6-deoxy-D-xylo-4-hexulose-3-dehydrase
VTVKGNAPFKRDDLTKYLNENKVETRNLFAGNITRQPAFINKNFRIAEHLNNTDLIMNNTFFLGTYPGLSDEMLNYVAEKFAAFMEKF